MEAAVQTARAATLHAARLKDAGLPFSREASIAKLVATDSAMKVTTDAVQVFGGYGYTRDFPVERYMREAKVMQIFEGTNQIQRMVIARSLAGQPRPPPSPTSDCQIRSRGPVLGRRSGSRAGGFDVAPLGSTPYEVARGRALETLSPAPGG